MKPLKELINRGDYGNAWNILLERARNITDYTEFLTLCRYRNHLTAKAPLAGLHKIIKIALLGGATTETLEAPLALSLESIGLGSEIYRSEYNTFAQEMLDGSSPTVAFCPEVAIIVNTPLNLPGWPGHGDSLKQVKQLVDETCHYWLQLCTGLHDRTGCEIILNNFHLLPTRPLGNLGAKLPWEANNFIRRVNLELGTSAPAYVHINDVETLSARYGVLRWFDPRYWFHAKQPVSFECLVHYVRNTVNIIGALFGRTSKCLVLDLDNTLWGGVVGDDGTDGIVIGEGDAVGEAFKTFQEYVFKLKQRGVLLAVCSKNEESNALEPFHNRTEMILKRDDFVSFKANWLPKPDNLRAIANELNIGIDSLVFVDDNPAEREHVRQRLPEVKVVELSDDPAEYPVLLDETGFFEVATLSPEDLQRTKQYASNLQRTKLQESAGDYASYLSSLQQKAVIRPFEEAYLDRITQLINKSNQFNLTTLRQSRSQVEKLMQSPDTLTAYVKLTDCFGDNGLISVFFAHLDNNELCIDGWLMSCRVLKRGVEQLLCNYIIEKSRSMGVSVLRGSYIPTPKNGLVRDHYQSLGFTNTAIGDDSSTHWKMEVKTYKPIEVQIELENEHNG